MDKQSIHDRKRVLVIGGSMAGLLAGRALSDAYQEVIIVERDELQESTGHRRGVPQGRHAHAILASGLETLEDFFPGIFDELVSRGAVPSDAQLDGRWFIEGGDLARSASGTRSVMSSRPLLEDVVRGRVRTLPGISIRSGVSVRGLITDGTIVRGIQTSSGVLEADLVVDATGRGSKAPKWLESMGFPQPPEERVGIELRYTTRYFRRHPRHLSGDSFAVVPPTPDGKRGGVVLAQEGGRWIVTLFEHFGQGAPADLEGYIAFARSLPAENIYDLLRDAEPIGDAVSFALPASTRRRYEKLDRYPAGLIVFGDAICSFNPAYGQGMSVAALQARSLRDVVTKQNADIARCFYRAAAKVIDNPWSIAVGGDLKMPETTGRRTLDVKLINWYLRHLHRCGHEDPKVASAFIRVAQLLDPPTALMRPVIVARVAYSALQRSFRSKKVEIASSDLGPGGQWRVDGF